MSGDELNETAELENTSAEDQQDAPSEERGQSDGSSETEQAHVEEDGAATISGLKDELGAVRAQADEYLDGWQRARAEFANYKKRVTREQEEARARIAGETIGKMLGIVDDLERALRDRPADGEAAAWAHGIELIYRKLMTILDSEGVEVIPAEGQPFDPMMHEALSHEESDEHDEGQVIEVIQPGYRMGERILRPALVRVAK